MATQPPWVGLVQIGITSSRRRCAPSRSGSFAGEGTTTVGAGYHGDDLLILQALVWLQLTVELHLDRLGRLVCRSCSRRATAPFATLEHELLGEDHAALLSVRVIGTAASILTVRPADGWSGRLTRWDDLGFGCRTVVTTAQTALGDIEVVGWLGQQGEQLVTALFQLVGQQFGGDDVTALGVQGQLSTSEETVISLRGVTCCLLGNLRNITGLAGFGYRNVRFWATRSRGRLRNLIGLPLLPEQEALRTANRSGVNCVVIP